MAAHNKVLCLKELTYSIHLLHAQALSSTAETTNNPHSTQNSKKEMVNEALVNMIVKDSFSIVEDAGFRELLHVLDPTYVIPTRKVTFGICWIARSITVEGAQVQQQMLLLKWTDIYRK